MPRKPIKKTVRNSLPGAIYRVQLSWYEPFTQDAPLVWPYNPESWNLRGSSRWEPRNAAGVSYDDVDWAGNGPQSIQFRSLLTVESVSAGSPARGTFGQPAAEVGADEGGNLEDFLTTLEQWATEATDITGEPGRFVLELGEHSFRVVIADWAINRIRTDARGRAFTAEVDVTFTRIP